MMYITPLRKTAANSFARVRFGTHAIGDQAPYLSITVDEYRSNRVSQAGLLSSGIQHETVREVFPELAPLLAWHLAEDGKPMHYFANARYWHNMARGIDYNGHIATSFETIKRSPDAFAATVALGVLPDDPTLGSLMAMEWPEVQAILVGRVPAMRAAFKMVAATIPALAASLGATAQ